MTDPKRLSASDSSVERALLRAARVRAPQGSKEHALMLASGALGASGAIPGGAAAGKGTAVGIAKVGSIASIKWVGIVGLTGIGMTAGAVAVHEIRESRPPMVLDMTAAPVVKAAPKRVHAKIEHAPRAGEAWTPVPVDPLTLASSSDVVLAPPVPARLPTILEDAGAASASTVPTELAMLEQARGALAAGDSARSLSILGRYAERFPRGAMMPEATMLRIEALVKAGDRGAATQFADAFLASDPESPYAARVRSLLETPDP
jgi:hypothetical protein